MNRSTKLDLVIDVSTRVDDEAAPTAALIVRRLKRDPVAPDPVVWHATAEELHRRGYDADDMVGACLRPEPSAVASLLRTSSLRSPSTVEVI